MYVERLVMMLHISVKSQQVKKITIKRKKHIFGSSDGVIQV